MRPPLELVAAVDGGGPPGGVAAAQVGDGGEQALNFVRQAVRDVHDGSYIGVGSGMADGNDRSWQTTVRGLGLRGR